jgi:predicted glutamine amidotransferase
MCRLLGSVAPAPVSLQNELLHADNALMRSALAGDAGWGLAVYPRGEGESPTCFRIPDTARAGDTFDRAARTRGRILLAHVRKATVGGLSEENTHPFSLGEYAFCHNGTISGSRRLLGRDGNGPRGETDSERLFHRVLREVDPSPERTVEGLRRAIRAAAQCGPLSGLSFLFSNGEYLYAYRLGLSALYWRARDGEILVASERLSDDHWHELRQDVLLTMKPGDDEPHAERLVGDDALAGITFDAFDDRYVPAGVEHAEATTQR